MGGGGPKYFQTPPVFLNGIALRDLFRFCVMSMTDGHTHQITSGMRIDHHKITCKKNMLFLNGFYSGDWELSGL